MQAGMGCYANWREWVVRKMLGATAIAVGLICLPALAAEAGGSLDDISANSIRNGCNVTFSKELQPQPNDPLSTPPFDILAKWVCRDGEVSNFDKYTINGSSPSVVTVLFWRGRYIVVLVKWSASSSASDYVGDFYEVFSYRRQQLSGRADIVRDSTIEKLFPPGLDGYARNGSKIKYSFKDAASIRKVLRSNNVK
ncbi:hypothetical protein [Burkholderia lata]|uniref:hypothetical protein n=1 Tax=Burkholderia lata (strain ATCC 17760 / DSM 23089 / LMG 22485 / NCIMB 9086 / R18194 / 383) TaxID=482957 RepID=UPI001581A0D7|nr:hypothetical protein [Burkholderia lata]